MNIAPDVLLDQYQRARRLWPVFVDIEAEFDLPPFLLYAVGSRETGLASKYAEGQVHADGHGWGLFGADDRWNILDLPHFASDPEEQARLAARSLRANFKRLGSWLDALNAYGPEWARGTDPGDYGPDVLDRAKYLAEHYGGSPSMKFVSRADWSARPPRGITGSSIARGVAVHWEGPAMGWPWPHSQCAVRVRSIQAFHMDSRGWADIAYNDLVCGHGYVFEGRGPDVRNAANGGNGDDNATHMAICYIGGEGDEFTAEARDAVNDAAEHLGVAGGDWRPHRYFTETACPGDEITAWIEAGHPSSTTTPTPPEPVPPPEEVSLFIFDGPDGGIFYTDGATWKRGVPNEDALEPWRRGLVPHLGQVSRAYFDALADVDTGRGAAAPLAGPLDQYAADQ